MVQHNQGPSAVLYLLMLLRCSQSRLTSGRHGAMYMPLTDSAAANVHIANTIVYIYMKHYMYMVM